MVTSTNVLPTASGLKYGPNAQQTEQEKIQADIARIKQQQAEQVRARQRSFTERQVQVQKGGEITNQYISGKHVVTKVAIPVTPEPVKPVQSPPANVFGYAQGTKEQPVNRFSQPVQTQQQRADVLVRNIQIKSALPITTKGLPIGGGQIELQVQKQEPIYPKAQAPGEDLVGFFGGVKKATVGFGKDVLTGGKEAFFRIQAYGQQGKDISKAPRWVQNLYGPRYAKGFDVGVKEQPSQKEYTFYTATALAGLPPGIGSAVFKGLTVYSAYQFIKEPSAEKAGELSVMLALPKVAETAIPFAKEYAPKAIEYVKAKEFTLPEIKFATGVIKESRDIIPGIQMFQLERGASIPEPYQNIRWTGIPEQTTQRTLFGTPIRQPVLRETLEPINPVSPIQTSSQRLMFGGKYVEGVEVSSFIERPAEQPLRSLIKPKTFTRPTFQALELVTESGQKFIDITKVEKSPYFTEPGNIPSLRTSYAVSNIPSVTTPITQARLGEFGFDIKDFGITEIKGFKQPKAIELRGLKPADVVTPGNLLRPETFAVEQKAPILSAPETLLPLAEKTQLPKPELIFEKKYQTAEYSLAGEDALARMAKPSGITTYYTPEDYSTFIKPFSISAQKPSLISGTGTISASYIASIQSSRPSQRERDRFNILPVQGLTPDISRLPISRVSGTQAQIPEQVLKLPQQRQLIYPISPIPPRPYQPQITSPLEQLPEFELNIPGFDFQLYTQARKKKKGKAYIALLKRRGKFKVISAPTTRLAALDIGTKGAVSTLGATFKIKAVGAEPMDVSTGGEFFKYRDMFRSYRLKKGQREQLSDTFIQRRGTRLGSIGEVTEIRQARVKMFG